MAQGSSVLNATGDAARITSSEITMPSQSFTCGCWFKRVNDKTGDWEAFISLRGSSHILIRIGSDNSWNNLASGSAVDLTGSLPTGEWFYLAVSANASNTKVYWYNSAGTLVSSNTTGAAPSSFNADDLTLANDNAANESRWMDGKIALGRVWNVALSQAQIEAELASSTPVVTSGLLAAFEDDPGAASPAWTESSLTLDGADYPALPYSGGSVALAGAATAGASATGALTIKKAKLRLDIAAAGEVVDGIVWANQAGAIAGAEIGEFTGQTIATGAGADAGFAVLKVPVSLFGGGSLNAGDTVQMFVRNSTKSSDLWPATIIEE